MSLRRQLDQRVRAAFRRAFDRAPEVVAVAPGRLNIVGEHTDYNEGFVLPAAIDRYIAVALATRADDRIVLRSDRYPTPVAVDALPSGRRGSWADYVYGVVDELRRRGRAMPGFDAAIASDIPVGSGLSSSGALEVASVMALLATQPGAEMPARELAQLCQGAENSYVGARTGIMDQLTALLARAGSALLLDCRSLSADPVPLPEAPYRWVLADTRVRHDLAASGFNERREQCEAAARALGFSSLRDASERDVEHLEDPVQRRRARHVVRENARVLQAVDALRRGAVRELGPILLASHCSLRDDFEVSCAELDCLVDLAQAVPEVVGARMMGGGFGGCVLVLLESTGTDSFEQRLSAGYLDAFRRLPAFYRVQSVDGAMPLGMLTWR